MSDRILVMRRGAVVAEFGRGDATQEDIMFAATGQVRDGKDGQERREGQDGQDGTATGPVAENAAAGPEAAAQQTETGAQGEEPR
jgi:hypothetical protein